MRLYFVTGLALVASVASAVAQDPVLVANSVVRAYSDYCQPGYFETYLPPDATWDHRLADSYARSLYTRYDADCSRFMRSDFLSALTALRMLNDMPELQRSDASSLTEAELGVLAAAIILREFVGRCPLVERSKAIMALEAGLRAKLVRADGFRLGESVSGTRVFLLGLDGYPAMTLDEQLECGAQSFLVEIAYLTLSSNGLLSPGDSQLMAPSPAPPIEEPHDAYADAILGSDNDALAADIAAISEFTGVWSPNATGCGTHVEYSLGQFEVGERRAFGVGAPRLAGPNFLCEASEFVVTGDIATFSAACSFDGESRSGQSTVRWSGHNTIQLSLLGNPKPIRLTKCPGDAN